ncbi:P-loop NTPase family protein [Georgenia subflava]|uniref:ParA family protein n=1 Tax=Georgenia subflava TaxID=1622177 RepID=A0A6N7EFJ8_9MICO|nr:hypothetical protein [Georgenia subflava]MPV35963.1 hypothetical protein [Georgenia subflava]
MAVITLCSAAGAPGVTTSTVGLAMCWPRPVLILEADPRGSSGLLAGFLGGMREYETGLVELALSPLDTSDALRDAVRPLTGDVSFVAGTRSHTQATGLNDLWGPLAEALADLEKTGTDVLIDAGPLGFPGSPEPLLTLVDLTLIVTRTHLPAVVAARSWTEAMRMSSPTWQQPGLLLVGEGQPYTAKEVTKVLDLPVVASITDDPDSAAVYHRAETPPRKFTTSPFIRSLHAGADAIGHMVTKRREDLLREVAP